MTKIILVRHGQSEANRTSSFSGQNETPLGEMGKIQAQAVAKALENEEIDVIYSSPLSRAYDTAKPTAKQKNLDIIKIEDFKEVSFGEWEGKDKTYLKENCPDYLKWREAPAFFVPAVSEGFPKAGVRFYNALKKLCEENENKTIAVFCHGGIMLAFLCKIGYYQSEKATFLDIPLNASLTCLIYDGEFKVDVVGVDEHLQGIKTLLTIV